MAIAFARVNIKGWRETVKSPGVRALLLREGRAIAAAAGPGFEAVANDEHPHVPRVFVQAETYDAARAEARDKRLTRAFGTRG